GRSSVRDPDLAGRHRAGTARALRTSYLSQRPGLRPRRIGPGLDGGDHDDLTRHALAGGHGLALERRGGRRVSRAGGPSYPCRVLTAPIANAMSRSPTDKRWAKPYQGHGHPRQASGDREPFPDAIG